MVWNLSCISKGATMIYPNETFDAEATLKAISEEKATAIYGVPMFFAELAS
jgi:fatty-acyl-CoA synthase